jgi:hypothetical protein
MTITVAPRHIAALFENLGGHQVGERRSDRAGGFGSCRHQLCDCLINQSGCFLVFLLRDEAL